MVCVTENPYLKVLRGRIRNLRKNIDKLDRLEQMAKQGVSLNPQQLESLRNKSSRQAALLELEDILARMESISQQNIVPSVMQQVKEEPKETEKPFTTEQQVCQNTTELDSSGSSTLLETAVQSEDGMEQLNKKQEETLQNILTVFHVSDFIMNEPEAVETIIQEGLELPQVKFGKLSRVHLDSVNYFAKMLTSPDGDVPLEKALFVSTYHAMEYLRRSKEEVIPGITYEFLYKIVSVIASHPLLLLRGTNHSSKTQVENVDSIAEQINFFAQPLEDEWQSGIDSISNLQIGDSSIAIQVHSTFSNSRIDDSIDSFQLDSSNNPSKIMIEDDNVLIIQNENTDSALEHFISSSARDISLEESISRSVFADTTDPFTKSNNSDSYQNGNIYRRNIDRVMNDLNSSSRENILSMELLHRNEMNEVSFLDWADEEAHQTSEETFELVFEPNSGMPKRIVPTVGKSRLQSDSQSAKSRLKVEDNHSNETKTRNVEQGVDKARKSRNKYSQYTSKYGTEGERNKTYGRQPLWTRRGRRSDSNGKESIRGRS